jgi:polysaccharide deacetylase family protein (PEP-CTERM system associated)
MATRPEDILTVDYEDWFHVADQALSDPGSWTGLPITVEEDTLRLLDLLDEHDARATFFVVGWLAERTPEVVGEIARRGHRLALHGYCHVPPNAMSESEFEEDVRRCARVIVEIAGVKPEGYRAPYFGIRDCSFPYLNVLRRCGLNYDASVFPGFLPGRGQLGATATPHTIDGLKPPLWEVPVSVTRLLGVPIAYSGGGFLRLLPPWFIRHCALKATVAGAPVVYYMHPRDLNPGGPVAATDPWLRFRYYGCRGTIRSKLLAVLSRSRLTSAEEFLSNAVATAGGEETDLMRVSIAGARAARSPVGMTQERLHAGRHADTPTQELIGARRGR